MSRPGLRYTSPCYKSGKQFIIFSDFEKAHFTWESLSQLLERQKTLAFFKIVHCRMYHQVKEEKWNESEITEAED